MPRGSSGVIAIALVFTIGLAVVHPSSGSTDTSLPVDATYQRVDRTAQFTTVLPCPPNGYDLTGAPEVSRNLIWLEYTSPETMVSLIEGTQRHPSTIRAMTGGGPRLGTVEIAGHTWTRYRNDDPILARTLPSGVQVVVRGGPRLTAIAAAVERTLGKPDCL